MSTTEFLTWLSIILVAGWIVGDLAGRLVVRRGSKGESVRQSLYAHEATLRERWEA